MIGHMIAPVSTLTPAQTSPRTFTGGAIGSRDRELRSGWGSDTTAVVDVRTSDHAGGRVLWGQRGIHRNPVDHLPAHLRSARAAVRLAVGPMVPPVPLLRGATDRRRCALRIVNTSDIGWATAGQIVIAVGQPLVLGAITKVCVDYLPQRNRATGIAAGTTGLFGGMLIAFVTGAVFEDNIPALLVIQAAFAVVVVAAMAIALARPGRFADAVDVSEGVTVESTRRHPFARCGATL